jgi:ABC-type polysaccharide/polyol phosphate export permease
MVASTGKPIPPGGRIRASQYPPYNPPVAVYADLIRYRELFASLFQRDLRAKYKGSVLGLFWTLALPVTLMLVYLVVFSVMWKSPTTDVDHYWLFLLCGLPPWVFFATSLQSSARSLVENASLIRKVRFPRQLVPLSIVATQLVAFVVMTGIVFVLVMIVLPDSRKTAWLVFPIAAVVVAFVSGLALAVASANAIYRDIEFVVAALLLPLFFLTPILYSLDQLPGAADHPWLLDLLQWGNPLTPVVESFRAPLFLGEVPSTGNLVYLVVETLVALTLGAVVFNAVDDRIAAEV